MTDFTLYTKENAPEQAKPLLEDSIAGFGMTEILGRCQAQPASRKRGNIQAFNFIPGPLGFTQKLQRRFDRRVAFEAIDIDPLRQPFPTIVFLKPCDDLFKRDAVQRVIRLFIAHVLNTP